LILLRWRPRRLLLVASIGAFGVALPPLALAGPRLSAYDALGSWVLVPIGSALAGPVGDAIGVRSRFLGAAAIVLAAPALVLVSRDVRSLTRRSTEAGVASLAV
jgi:hypothetical protein